MLKNNDRWEENDIKPIVEYCITSGITASMTQEGKEMFNSWALETFETYPKDGIVIS